MNTKRILAIALLMVSSFGAVSAQMVTPVGLGIRLNPDGGGITGKFFFDRHLALEAQLNVSGGYYNVADYGPSRTVVALLEYHFILNDPSWRIFLGPGIHFGSWDRYGNYYHDYYYGSRAVQGIFGIDGTLGVEYVFKTVPIGLTVDIKPAMNFTPDAGPFPNNFFGIGGRYYLGHRMANAHHKTTTQQ